jgi:hypothetical protein
VPVVVRNLLAEVLMEARRIREQPLEDRSLAAHGGSVMAADGCPR